MHDVYMCLCVVSQTPPQWRPCETTACPEMTRSSNSLENLMLWKQIKETWWNHRTRLFRSWSRPRLPHRSVGRILLGLSVLLGCFFWVHHEGVSFSWSLVGGDSSWSWSIVGVILLGLGPLWGWFFLVLVHCGGDYSWSIVEIASSWYLVGVFLLRCGLPWGYFVFFSVPCGFFFF